MVSAYGLHLRRLRYGHGHQQFLDVLRHAQWHSHDEIERQQLLQMRIAVEAARDAVPFYRNRLPEDPIQSREEFANIPILTKADVRRARREMVHRTFSMKRPLVIHTGGTTGSPMSVYCDRAALRRNYAFFSRFREWIGIGASARVATFAGRTIVPPGQAKPPYWRHNFAGRTLLFSSYHVSPATIPAYVTALARFAPEMIDSYPSSIVPIARYMLDRGITAVRPTAVVTSSETLTAKSRQIIEAAFGCPVFDYYGAAEMAAFVTQCRAGSYHVNPEYGFVEIVRDGRPARPGEAGEIIATGFVNPSMPFIRYATGDIAVQGHAGCACGRAFPVLERIVGRIDDVLVSPDGRHIGRLDPIFKAVSSLVETRIVQDQVDHVRVETVADGAIPPAEQATLVHELRNRLGPAVRIDVVHVAQIARTSGGKFRSVVNLVSGPSEDAINESEFGGTA